ncbi:MAG: hypothetical protein LUQ20_01935 [Candidatus Methanoperedens sp.]|nr:hypothetical protein [Candidatus Methanoperedens sp.]
MASGEPFENIAKREVQEEYLRIGVPATYTFTTPELPVYEVSITPAKNFAEGDISMLRWMEFGVNVARRGWLEKKDLMNSRSCRDVRFKSRDKYCVMGVLNCTMPVTSVSGQFLSYQQEN